MKNLSIILLISAALFSCKKNKDAEKSPAAAVTDTGSVMGKITQVTARGNTYTNSLAGVTVTILKQNLSAITAADGSYRIPGVEAGMLDIEISNTDGGGLIQQQKSFAGNGDLIFNQPISRKSSDTLRVYMRDTIIGADSGVYLLCNHWFSNSIGTNPFLIVMSNSSNFDPGNINTFNFSVQGLLLSKNNAPSSCSQFWTYNQIKQFTGLTTGQTLFLNAFALPYTLGSYKDLYQNKYVSKCYGFSSASNFIKVLP